MLLRLRYAILAAIFLTVACQFELAAGADVSSVPDDLHQINSLFMGKLTKPDEGSCTRLLSRAQALVYRTTRLFSQPMTDDERFQAQSRLDELSRRPLPQPGKILNDIVIITHQLDSKQEATTDFLSEFIVTPRVLILGNRDFLLKSKGLAEKASYFQISNGGEISPKRFLAKNVTFLGGVAEVCLSRSINDILDQAMQAQMTEINLHFMARHIYGSPIIPVGRITAQSFAQTLKDTLFLRRADRLTAIENSFRNSAFDLEIQFIIESSPRLKVSVHVER